MPQLVPYEIFLLRRLQQAQRLASSTGRPKPASGKVVALAPTAATMAMPPCDVDPCGEVCG